MASVAEWYWTVRTIMESHGIPESVWGAILLVESGGDPNAVGDGGDSIGLFQANRNGGQGVGYSVEQLKDPATNARAVAPQIAEAVRICGAENMNCILAHSQRPATSTYPKYTAALAEMKQAGNNLIIALTNRGGFQEGDPAISPGELAGKAGEALADAAGIPAWLRNPAGTLHEVRHSLVFALVGLLLVLVGLLGFARKSPTLRQAARLASPVGKVMA